MGRKQICLNQAGYDWEGRETPWAGWLGGLAAERGGWPRRHLDSDAPRSLTGHRRRLPTEMRRKSFRPSQTPQASPPAAHAYKPQRGPGPRPFFRIVTPRSPHRTSSSPRLSSREGPAHPPPPTPCSPSALARSPSPARTPATASRSLRACASTPSSSTPQEKPRCGTRWTRRSRTSSPATSFSLEVRFLAACAHAGRVLSPSNRAPPHARRLRTLRHPRNPHHRPRKTP